MNYGYWYYLPTGELCYELSWQDGNIDYLRLLLYMLSIAYTKEEDINEEKIVKIVKKLIICFGLMFTVESFLPSKKACYQMMIASQVTKENIQKAEDTIKSSVDYIFEKINEK